jgi:hypothetical protein
MNDCLPGNRVGQNPNTSFHEFHFARDSLHNNAAICEHFEQGAGQISLIGEAFSVKFLIRARGLLAPPRNPIRAVTANL